MGDTTGAHWRVFGVPTPLVGREALLDELALLVDDAVGEATPRIITLRGPEGIGRTRVLRSLEHRLEAAGDDRLILRAQVGGDGPLPALTDLLRQRFYVRTGADAAAWRAALGDGFRALLGAAAAPEAVAALGPDLGIPAGSERPDAELAERALAAWLAADARRQPLVLVLDDVDRADPAAARMLVRAVARVTAAPIIVIFGACDPSVYEALGCSADRSDVREISVAPLDAVDVARLVEQLIVRVEDDRAPVIDWVVERAAGNPLIAEELVRILIADGIIDTRGDAWHLHAERLDPDGLRGDLDAIVRARVARLTDEDRALLVRAALVGDRFWTGALIAVERASDVAPDDVEHLWSELPTPIGSTNPARSAPTDPVHAAVARMAARDVVVPCPRPDLPGEACWAFKHRAEQRALASLADDATRRAVGTAVGRWLVVHAGRGSSIARRAADQFAAAGEATRAAALYREAAAASEQRHAWPAAIDNYERTLALLPARDLDLRVDTLQRLGAALARTGDFERSIPVFEDVVRDAWRIASRAHAADAFDALGRAWRSLGEYDRALRFFERSLALSVSMGDRASSARALDGLGRVAWARGDHDLAEARYTHALVLRRDVGDALQIAASLHRLGVLRVERGAFRDALNLFRESLAIRRDHDDAAGVATQLASVGDVVLQRGDADTARRVWAEALAAAEAEGDAVMQGLLHVRMVEAALHDDDLDAAASHLRAAEQVGVSTRDRALACDVLRLHGDLDARRGNRQSAVNTLRDAVAEAREAGSRRLEGLALLSLARLRGDLGADAEAEQNFRDAEACLRDAGAEVELARAWQRYGTWLLESGMLVKGKKHLAMAGEILERLEMRRVLAWSSGMDD